MANVCPLRWSAVTIALSKALPKLDDPSYACLEGDCAWFNEGRNRPARIGCAVKNMAKDLEVVADQLQDALVQKVDA